MRGARSRRSVEQETRQSRLGFEKEVTTTHTAGDLLQRLVENPRALCSLPPHLLELFVLRLDDLLQLSKLVAEVLDFGLNGFELLGRGLLLAFEGVESDLLRSGRGAESLEAGASRVDVLRDEPSSVGRYRWSANGTEEASKRRGALVREASNLSLELEVVLLLRLDVAHPRIFVDANVGDLDALAEVLEDGVLLDSDGALVFGVLAFESRDLLLKGLDLALEVGNGFFYDLELRLNVLEAGVGRALRRERRSASSRGATELRCSPSHLWRR